MAREYTREGCPFYGTKYCKLLNMLSCESCTVAGLSSEGLENVRRDLDVLLDLVPPEGVYGLAHRDGCIFCRGANVQPRAWYAYVNLGNAKPKRERRQLFGVRTRPHAGSLVRIQLAGCDRCRRNYSLLEYLPSAVGVLAVGVMLALLSVRAFRETLAATAPWLPAAFFGFGAVLGVLMAVVVKRLILARHGRETYFRVVDIPELAPLVERGWFEVENKRELSRAYFAKKPLRIGVLTGKYPSIEEETEQNV